MTDKEVELANLSVLGEYEVGLEMKLVLTNGGNDPTPENVPESSNQGEEVYNTDLGHDGIFWWHLTDARNQNLRVHFSPDTNPTKLKLFQMFFFRHFIEGALLHNTNERI